MVILVVVVVILVVVVVDDSCEIGYGSHGKKFELVKQ